MTDFDGAGGLSRTYDCAEASCRQCETNCSFEDANFNYNSSNLPTAYFDDIYQSLEKVCNGVQGELDADIAGPGVSTRH